MKKHFYMIKVLLFCFFTVFPFLLSADDLKIPALTGRIVDETFTLTEADKSALTDELKKLETEKGSQIAVLVIDTVGELGIEEYGIKVAEAWKLGRKDVSDGAILIVALKDKKMRIEVGRGLEGFLTDLRTKQIQEKIIKPEFKNGNFSGGIRQGTEAMITLARGAELPLPEETPEKLEGTTLATIVFCFILLGLFLEIRFYNLIWRILIAVLSVFFIYWYVNMFSSF
ncbi:MAG TPA: TPM domain-containing protein, partial [Leptospiraceae bacterium]|nr:TPM domain-containing protein [Leptospiraceae bacterium]